MRKEYPKKIKRSLRELGAKAYERELHRELNKVDKSFEEWRTGSISSGELSKRIHQYETGPSHALFQRYNSIPHDMSVAYAIVVGILERNEIPDDVLTAIQGPLDFYQSLKDRDELKMPEEM